MGPPFFSFRNDKLCSTAPKICLLWFIAALESSVPPPIMPSSCRHWLASQEDFHLSGCEQHSSVQVRSRRWLPRCQKSSTPLPQAVWQKIRLPGCLCNSCSVNCKEISSSCRAGLSEQDVPVPSSAPQAPRTARTHAPAPPSQVMQWCVGRSQPAGIQPLSGGSDLGLLALLCLPAALAGCGSTSSAPSCAPQWPRGTWQQEEQCECLDPAPLCARA